MQESAIIVLCVIVWIHTVLSMRSGGGPVTVLAILSTFALWAAGMIWSLVTGHDLVGWALLFAAVLAFFVVIFVREENLMLN